MKNSVSSGRSAAFDATVNECTDCGDWRGKMLAKIRTLIHESHAGIIEEQKWAKATNPAGVPVFSHNGIICTVETYRTVVKLTFAKGASLDDPAGLFNSSLEGNSRRAIDIREGDRMNEKALKDLIGAAVTHNSRGKLESRSTE